jgi:hypothetical protein
MAPPPEDPAVLLPLLVGVAGAACTLIVVLAVPVAPPLSVTVRLTVTAPDALVTSVAVLAVVLPLKAASVPPLVICHW